MCTVTWLHDDEGYQLFCNRDEQRSRGIATPPRLAWAGDVRYVAPRDANHGGTWVAVNQFGITLCLLNGAKRPETSAAPRSRGLLVPSLMSCRSAQAAVMELAPIRLREYAPFTLVALDAAQACFISTWDGVEASANRSTAEAGLLSSSSFDAEGALSIRQSLLDRLRTISGASLRSLHASHAGGAGAYSPCMHRADAETVSFTRITVRPRRIRLAYSPDAPCRRRPAIAVELLS